MNNKIDKDIAQLMLANVQETLEIETLKKSEEKILVMIGGQPGSGKSSLINKVRSTYSGHLVVLNSDDVKNFHPEYEDLLVKNSNLADEYVQPYSNYVIDKLKNHLVNNGYSVLVEGTLRNSETPLKAAKEFKEHGYNVEVHVLSVNEQVSWLRCINRYERDVAQNGYGRSVTKDYHDNAYKNIPNTLKDIINSGSFDNIVIYNKAGMEIENIANKMSIIPSYINERDNFSRDVLDSCLELVEEIEFYKLQRGASKDELKELDIIRNNIIKNYEKNTKKKGLLINDNTTNKDVLNYFSQFIPSLTHEIITNNKISDPTHYIKLNNEKPEKLAEYLKSKCSHKDQSLIKIQIDKPIITKVANKYKIKDI